MQIDNFLNKKHQVENTVPISSAAKERNINFELNKLFENTGFSLGDFYLGDA